MRKYCGGPCAKCAQLLIVEQFEAIMAHEAAGCRCKAHWATLEILRNTGWDLDYLSCLWVGDEKPTVTRRRHGI